jgi:hypothetical protein
MGRWPLHLRAGGCALLASADLGFLLRRTAQVLVRTGERPALVAGERLIAWRTLQIVVGTPVLPDLHELRALYPGLRVDQGRIALPLGLGGGEAALAVCAQAGMAVSASWIEYEAAGSG